jgi:hypothetical protein
MLLDATAQVVLRKKLSGDRHSRNGRAPIGHRLGPQFGAFGTLPRRVPLGFTYHHLQLFFAHQLRYLRWHYGFVVAQLVRVSFSDTISRINAKQTLLDQRFLATHQTGQSWLP